MDMGLFFYYRAKGEPLISRTMGNHSVVAYSFDKNSIWISDSGVGTRRCVTFDTIIKIIFALRGCS